MVKKQDLQESGKVHYYGLMFSQSHPDNAEKYWQKEAERIAAEERGEPWEIGNMTYLGYDTYEENFSYENEFLKKALMWFRFNKSEGPECLEAYVDGDSERGKYVENAIDEETNDDLFDKYDIFRSFMQFFNEVTMTPLPKLAKEYDLTIHVFSDVLRNEIILNVEKDSLCEEFVVDSNYNIEKTLEKDILPIINSSLLTQEEKRNMRKQKIRTVLEFFDNEFFLKYFHPNPEKLPNKAQRKFDFYNGHYKDYKALVEQVPEDIKKAYVNFLRHNEYSSDIPHKVFGKFSFARRFKRTMKNVLEAELFLFDEKGETDAWKFQNCVDILVNYALERPNDFDIKQQILLSTHYGILPDN